MDNDATRHEVTFPPNKDSWWSPERVEYMRNLLSVITLFLAFPYIIVKIIRNPGKVATGAMKPVTVA